MERNERFEVESPEQPDVPSEYEFLLDAFWSLNNGRSSNGFSLNPVSWLEQEAWQRGTGNVLTNDETRIIMSLFGVHDSEMEECRPKEGGESE